MIYTSDNEIYEDETAHALGVKHPDTVNYQDHQKDLSQADIQSMTHQLEKPLDEVQKTIRATIEHFKNTFMQGPDLMKDFMEGKVTSEDESAIRRAMSVGWKTTPIAPRGLPMKVIDVEPEGSADALENAEPSDLDAIEKIGRVGIHMNPEGLGPPSKNIEDRGDYDIFDKFRHHPLFEELKSEFTRGGTNIKDNTSRLGHKLGREDINKIIDDAIDRTKLRAYGQRRLDIERGRKAKEDFPEFPIEDFEEFKPLERLKKLE